MLKSFEVRSEKLISLFTFYKSVNNPLYKDVMFCPDNTKYYRDGLTDDLVIDVNNSDSKVPPVKKKRSKKSQVTGGPHIATSNTLIEDVVVGYSTINNKDSSQKDLISELYEAF